MSQHRRQTPNTKPHMRKWFIVGGIVILALIISGAVWGFHQNNKTTIATKPTNAVTAGQDTKGEPVTSQATSGGSGTNNKTGGDTSSANTTLIAPQGDFVSNHHPNLGGSPAPNTEQSVCNTTPGATCQIIFTKDGITQTLPSQTADSGGAAYWSWKLQDLNLTEGTWKVSAKATLGSQTKTADDALQLEVAR